MGGRRFVIRRIEAEQKEIERAYGRGLHATLHASNTRLFMLGKRYFPPGLDGRCAAQQTRSIGQAEPSIRIGHYSIDSCYRGIVL